MAASKPATIAVHLPQSPEERARIYAFRYRVEIMKKGGASVFADDKKMSITDDLDVSAVQLCLVKQHAVAASVRINSTENTKFSEKISAQFRLGEFSKFQPKDLSLTSRLVVSDDDSPGQLTAVLLGAAYKVARNMGSRFDFTSCPPPLVPLYERLGYRRYADNFVDEDDVYHVPLVLLTDDLAHLRYVGSPFSKLAVEFTNTAEASQWFERTFPDSLHSAAEGGLDEEDFWSLLTEKLHQTPIEGIPLLKDMTYAAAKRILHTGSTLQCKRGDRIVQAGATSREMYVILSGSVEVRSGDHMVAELGRGDIFGEIALISSAPRTADVVALEDVEVLILSQDFLEKGMRTMPDIMSRVLYNLSMILVERLRDHAPVSADGSAASPPATNGSAAAPPVTKQDQRRSA